MIQARAEAASKALGIKPVEKGVTGKEKLFQQNRNFGPGPIKPYPEGGKSGMASRSDRKVPSTEKPRGGRGSGVYHGYGGKGTPQSGYYKTGESRA